MLATQRKSRRRLLNTKVSESCIGGASLTNFAGLQSGAKDSSGTSLACDAKYRAATTTGGRGKTQGRFLSSIASGDWQLFLLSSSFSCRWGWVCNESSQFRSGSNDR